MKPKSSAEGREDKRQQMVDAVKDLLASELVVPEVAEQIADTIVAQAQTRCDVLQERTRQIHQDLGPRRFRLLLAACCRHACRQAFQGFSWKDQAQAIEVLEEVADTGKGKASLRDFWRTSKSTWNIRDRPELFALHLALSPTDPEDALVPCVKAIQETCRLSEQAAWNQLKRYYDDLAPPSLDVGDFADAWRTPSVVGLARTMYESSDFSGMPRLAEALIRAGCGHQVVLDHCRDTHATHIRGCWLLDAILQDWIATRSSTGKKPDAASRGGGRKKSFLSKVSKRGRDEITRIMEERDGHLPLEDFLAKRWDVMGFCKSASHFDERAANRITEWQSELAQLHPEWSVDQVQTVMSLAQLTANLREVAIARRFTLDDPGELGRGLSVLYRLLRIGQNTWACNAVSAVGDFIEACAVRDIGVVQSLVEGARAGYTAIPTDRDLQDIAEIAVLQKDVETLRSAVTQMPHRKVRPWMQGIYTCLTGVSERQPDQVAKGLELYLSGLHQMRQKAELEEAINLGAQGLYRLCEWVTPDLVAEFDVMQAFPWDAEFHTWCQNHPDPLEGVDLSRISPVLHEAVVLGAPPEWLAPSPVKRYEIVLHSADPKSPEVLERIGSCAGTSGALREAKQLLERCPVVLRWNLELEYAERVRKDLQDAGASVTVRVMERRPFPFC